VCGKRNLNRTRNFQKHKDATKECIFYWEKCYLQLSLIKLTENIGFRGKRERYVHERAMIIALKVARKEAFRFETRKRSVVFKGAGFRFSKGFHNRRKQTWGILMELVNNKLNERKCTHWYIEQTKSNCGAHIQSTNIEALSDETFDKITFTRTAIFRLIWGGKKSKLFVHSNLEKLVMVICPLWSQNNARYVDTKLEKFGMDCTDVFSWLLLHLRQSYL